MEERNKKHRKIKNKEVGRDSSDNAQGYGQTEHRPRLTRWAGKSVLTY
jgi:hypothetical protein